MTLKGGNSKGKILRKKDRKHTFDQEKKKDSRKKERKHANDQEKNMETKISTTLSTTKKKTSFKIFLFFFL